MQKVSENLEDMNEIENLWEEVKIYSNSLFAFITKLK